MARLARHFLILLAAIPTFAMAFPTTSRATRLYGGDIAAITPGGEDKPVTGKAMYLADGIYSKTASVVDGKLTLSPKAFPDDGLGVLLRVLKRRAGTEGEIDTAIDHVVLAIEALDSRAVRKHGYSESKEEAELDIAAFTAEADAARERLGLPPRKVAKTEV